MRGVLCLQLKCVEVSVDEDKPAVKDSDNKCEWIYLCGYIYYSSVKIFNPDSA